MKFIKLGLYEPSPLISAVFCAKESFSKMGLSLVDVADVRAAGKVLAGKKLSGDAVQLDKTSKKSKTITFLKNGALYKFRKLANGSDFQVIYEKLPDGKHCKTQQLFVGGNTKELKKIVWDEKGDLIERDYCIHIGKPSRPAILPPAKFSSVWLKDNDDAWWIGSY